MCQKYTKKKMLISDDKDRCPPPGPLGMRGMEMDLNHSFSES